jgi:hypothetical protein
MRGAPQLIHAERTGSRRPRRGRRATRAIRAVRATRSRLAPSSIATFCARRCARLASRRGPQHARKQAQFLCWDRRHRAAPAEAKLVRPLARGRAHVRELAGAPDAVIREPLILHARILRSARRCGSVVAAAAPTRGTPRFRCPRRGRRARSHDLSWRPATRFALQSRGVAWARAPSGSKSRARARVATRSRLAPSSIAGRPTTSSAGAPDLAAPDRQMSATGVLRQVTRRGLHGSDLLECLSGGPEIAGGKEPFATVARGVVRTLQICHTSRSRR